MAGERKRENRRSREWGELIREQASSAQGPEAFCRQRGLVLSTFRWWQWRLSSEKPKGVGHRSDAPLPPARGGFAPVRLVDRGGEPTRAFDFEICLGSGSRVLVRRDFEAAALARLLAVLEGSGC